MDKRLELWERLRKLEESDGKENPRGHYSVAGHDGAIIVKEFISVLDVKGKALDIGCGPLPRPLYMVEHLDWYGIDPTDNVNPEFNYTKGMSEDLPYEDEMFDFIIYSTSLEHTYDPEQSFREAVRVLKQNGLLMVWGNFGGYSYFDLKEKEPQVLNKYHVWTFLKSDVKKLFQMCNLVTYKEKDWARGNVLVGKKE